MTIGLFLVALWGFDVLMTYLSIVKVKKHFPEKTYDKLEYNKMNVYFWNKFGLEKGTLISMVCQFPLLVLIIILCLNYPNCLFMAFGMYVVVFYIHYTNFMGLRELEKEIGGMK